LADGMSASGHIWPNRNAGFSQARTSEPTASQAFFRARHK
jgi:hypothetical protein